jgi:hypothetical protein
MNKRAFSRMVLLAALAGPYLAAQFTPPEIARRDFWESFMSTAEIVKFKDEGEGVTRPARLYLKKGDVEARGIWKSVDERVQGDLLDSWKHEVAAYRLDKLLGLNMIPPVVEREFQGKPGSLSFFVTSKFSLLKMMEQNIAIPAAAADQTSRMKYVTRAFDCLIANDDRTQQNILYTEDWRTILIDHSRAFRSDKEHVERLIYGKNGFKTAAGRPMLFRQLPRSFVQAVTALDLAGVKKAVGTYLSDDEIKAILERQKLLLAEVNDLIKENGEAKVLY